VKAGVIAYKIAAHAADLAKVIHGNGRGTCPVEGAVRVPLAGSVQPLARSATARAYHDDAARRRLKVAHFCSMCGPKFSHGADAAGPTISWGMEEKSLEFRRKANSTSSSDPSRQRNRQGDDDLVIACPITSPSPPLGTCLKLFRYRSQCSK
jgi:hypothetical protein